MRFYFAFFFSIILSLPVEKGFYFSFLKILNLNLQCLLAMFANFTIDISSDIIAVIGEMGHRPYTVVSTIDIHLSSS